MSRNRSRFHWLYWAYLATWTLWVLTGIYRIAVLDETVTGTYMVTSGALAIAFFVWRLHRRRIIERRQRKDPPQAP